MIAAALVKHELCHILAFTLLRRCDPDRHGDASRFFAIESASDYLAVSFPVPLHLMDPITRASVALAPPILDLEGHGTGLELHQVLAAARDANTPELIGGLPSDLAIVGDALQDCSAREIARATAQAVAVAQLSADLFAGRPSLVRGLGRELSRLQPRDALAMDGRNLVAALRGLDRLRLVPAMVAAAKSI